MNLIESVAQRLQQKENKVSFLIRSAALLASIRATGEMNNWHPPDQEASRFTVKKDVVHRNTEQAYWEYVKELAAEEGIDPADEAAMVWKRALRITVPGIDPVIYFKMLMVGFFVDDRRHCATGQLRFDHCPRILRKRFFPTTQQFAFHRSGHPLVGTRPDLGIHF
jgi:hypothetical protein